MNGDGNTDLPGTPASVEAELRELIGRLNGQNRFAFLLWRLPDGRSLHQVGPDDDARGHYIQCAGNFDGRLTTELRELVDGVPHQYVLGRAADDSTEADQEVPYANHAQYVRPNEVLTGPEVVDLFIEYYRTGDIPAGYVRRELEL
ncbi:MAG: hypothetical protein J2O48_04690 [Solirubrobacterales bacterium]|nr:hypothetical protein [Solirubrobacterales bacterium]